LTFEQVPPVLPLWDLMADILRERGYHCWTGVLSSERYGVPQTRKRAFLIASLDGPVHPPEPTHQAYVPGEPAQAGEADLFGGGLLPWVSMARALGWEEGTKARSATWMRSDGQPNAAVRSSTEPAPTIKAGHCTAERVWLRAGTNKNDVQRESEQPAPTLRFGARMNDVSWLMSINNDRPERTEAGAGNKPRPVDAPAATVDSTSRQATWQRRDSGPGAECKPRPIDAPSFTVRGAGSGSAPSGVEWVTERPATDAIRVTVQEAAILQTFPPDYPWQGSRSRQFLQIGNAVPPLMAKAVLATVAQPINERIESC
jgi:DNA (cytosine-5)-methyltransferase 1